MKTKFEYLISDKYLPHWSILDGIREFLQNAYDSDKQHSSETVKVEYADNILAISNKGTIEPETLLLGNGTKSGNDGLSGQFGEGYKLGSLVLARNNIKVSIEDGLGNLYKPSIEFRSDLNSNIFVFTKEELEAENTQANQVIITISPVSDEQFNSILNNTLELKHPGVSSKNIILYDPEEKGRIYINGLYVTTLSEFQYGYNFRSNRVSTNRDRNLVSTFSVKWETSKLWQETITDENTTATVADLLEANVPDVELCSNTISTDLANKLLAYFQTKYKNKKPISSESDRHKYLSYGYSSTSFVHIPSAYRNVLTKSSNWVDKTVRKPMFPKNANPTDALVMFETAFGDTFTNEVKEAFAELITVSKRWRYKSNKTITT
jgi:hypothetical protein